MGSQPIRVIHITDTHVTAEPEAQVYGIDSFEALRNLLPLVEKMPMKQDLILATGDLSQDGSKASYDRFRSLLKPLSIPVYCLPGNHDVALMMSRCLRRAPVHVQRLVLLDHWLIVFLDSHISGHDHGYLSTKELAALDRAIGENQDRYALICLHHGPFAVCPMLPCRLDNAEEFLAIVRRYSNVRCVLSGHNHCAVDDECGGVRMLVTPSTFVQISHPTSSEDGRPFWQAHALDASRQGFRRLELHPDGQISTEVVWVASGI